MDKSKYAIKITTDGKWSFVEIERENEHDFVKQIQREVGGFFEIALIDSPEVSDELALHIDEEAKLKGKPINVAATLLYNNSNDVICGDVLIMPIEVDPDSEYGERDSMPMETMTALVVKNYLKMLVLSRSKPKERGRKNV